jgi:thermostable 8-oxoguanine DNA glycosylase
VEFIIGKTKVKLTRESVEGVLEKLDPEPFKGRRAKYYVEFRERRYPIKQVLAAATGLPKVSFTTMHPTRC